MNRQQMISSTLYTKQAVRFFDQQMIEHYVDSGYQLMTRAAQSVLDVINQYYPKQQSILIFCGQGNNAGDGYVLARLAMQQGIHVQLVSLAEPRQLKGDALKAYQDWQQFGGTISALESVNYETPQLIVDALLGTGLDRNLNPQWLQVVHSINHSGHPVIALDIPTGLDADTGAVWGAAVKAQITVTFIALKAGLYTGQARNYCGEIIFKSLGVPNEVYQQVQSSLALLNWTEQLNQLPKRHHSSHKGEHGKVLIIGGNRGMAGAARIAGEAALRTGAGLVTILTHPDSVGIVSNGRPELMVIGFDNPANNVDEIKQLFDWADSIAIGPGLGQDPWAKALLQLCLQQTKLKILDADALNLLARFEATQLANYDYANSLITPHPGEAARLLQTKIEDVEKDRFQALRLLQEKYAAIVVLKGAGTLIAAKSNDSPNTQGSEISMRVCPYGNAGMASGGMGDCLTGIIATLVNQTTPQTAVELAVSIHAKAADKAAKEGQIGLLASDLMEPIRQLINT